jgi:hypothetical protein
VVDGCTALVVIGHGAYASIVGGDVWDFWAIWGLKARVFFEHRGIDWRFLEHPYNAFAHPDYPPLLPLHFAHVTLLGGEWSERWLGILTTLFGAALLLVVRDLFEEELQRPVVAALATLAVASPAFSMIGVGDGPMIAFGTAALLTIRRGSLAAGGVLLGLAAFAKNEGIVLVIAAALALRNARAILRLWPAAAIAAPWLILRAVHSLPTDIVSGALSERLARNLTELPGALAATLPDQPLLWLAIAITLAVFVRDLRSERFVLVAVSLQLLAYLAAYAVTPYDVHWHVRSSWPRLLPHLAVPLAFVALVLSAREALRASGRRTRSAAG